MEEKNKRNSNHELLRILATLMVLGLHYLKGIVGGGGLDPLNTSSINFLISEVLESLCIPAVNIFILITGYYSYQSNKIKINRAVELYLITIFYGIVFLVLNGTVTVRNLIYSIVPFLKGEAWFVETYIILLLIIPFLNKIVNNISKKGMAYGIAIQLVLFSFWPTFLPSSPVLDGGYGITNFILLYFIGAFIGKYSIRVNKWILIFVEVICVILMSKNNIWWSYCSLFCISSATAIFLLFTDIKSFNNKIINYIAGYCFSVYIIHSDPNIVIFWYRTLIRTDLFWKSEWFIMHFFLSILLLFGICIMIDIIRKLVFKYTIYIFLKRNRFSEIPVN